MADQIVNLTVKYNGRFEFFPKKNSAIYRGGSSRTFVVDIDRTSLKDLHDDVMASFKETDYLILRLAYFVPKAMPCIFKYMETDADYMEMLQLHLKSKKCILYLTWDYDRLPRSNIPDAIVACQKFQLNAIGNYEVKNAEVKVEVASEKVQIKKEEVQVVDEKVQIKKEEVQVADEKVQIPKEEAQVADEKVQIPKEEVQVADEEILQEKLSLNQLQKELDAVVEEAEKMGLFDDIEHCNDEDKYHDYYSSASDEDDDDDDFVVEGDDDKSTVDSPFITIGKTFASMQEFKTCLRQHAIVEKFELKVVKSDKTRHVVACAGEKCAWRLRAVVHKVDKSTVEIRTITSRHTCIGVNQKGNSQASASWIGNEIVKLVKNNRNLTPKEIGDFMKEKYQLESIPYSRLWRARDMSRGLVYGDIDDNYSFVPSLRAELLKRNNGSHIEYELGANNSFLRFFLSFKCMITGFKNHCRPFIGLDGCHLRGKYLGTLLSAVALDGNNGIYPLAVAVVEGEGFESWKWFLQNIKIALGGEIDHLTLMSDMEKGLEEAMRCVMPTVEHRVCMRHLWKNMKKSFHGEFYERVVWAAARAYTRSDMWRALRELKNASEEAFSLLTMKGKDNDGNQKWVWSRSEFRMTSKNQYITNNLSESFNAWIMDSRSLPVCDLIDKLRVKIMHMMYLRRQQSQKWRGLLTPMVEKYLQEMSKENTCFQKIPSGANEWEVSDGTIRKMVDIGKKVCSCRRWQLIGLPCAHAMSVLCSIRNLKWEDYVHEYYHTSSYIQAYKDSIAMMPSKEEWDEVNLPYTVGPPYSKRPRGRPKKERIRGEGEKRKSTKSKLPHRCGRCGGWGHHANTCKEPLNPVNQSQSSRISSTGGKKRKKTSAPGGSVSQGEPIAGNVTQEVSTSQLTARDDTLIKGEFHISPFKQSRNNASTSTPSQRGKRKPLRGRLVI